MGINDIPEDLQHFLLTIDSVEQLRVLLLLFSEPTRAWSATEITQSLSSVETSIENRLDELYRRGILIRKPELEGKHGFTPASEKIRDLVKRLEAVNRVRPYRVIEAIYSRPPNAVHAFADAFKIKGDKK